MVSKPIYNPLDPTVLADPYPVYRKLREEYPVFWHDQMESWVVTRYRDCQEVLRNHARYARDRRRVGIDVPEFRQNLQSLDPPQLAPLRSLLMNAFHSQDLEEVGFRTRARVSEIFTRFLDEPEFDWISQVAAPVALTLTSELFGIVEPDLDRYTQIADAITRRMDAGLDPSVVLAGDQARKELNSLADQWLDSHYAKAGLLTTIKETLEGSGVPEHYIRNTTGVMFNASYGTVFAAAGNFVYTLLNHPGTLEQFRDDEIMARGVEELIRFDGPAQGTTRIAVKRSQLGGQTIEAGQPIITLLAAANRDPDEFPRPEELVLNRSPNRHLGFGWGPHACLGARFGNVAIQEIIRCLLGTPATLEMVDQPVRRATATVRSMDSLPVRFTQH
ncbi:cytochrome P450 [Streptomyces sp. SID8379]|uniref:cytochrome P450 n=1 Tax=unclassified Streptomyces TaxID=2593676 RepID=UPI0004754BC3|nr:MULTISPECIES: cytochrome P450 [unclassified Streptomyces]MYW67209.1 cytochrome P450 [Streptomyces sp. SID8379]